MSTLHTRDPVPTPWGGGRGGRPSGQEAGDPLGWGEGIGDPIPLDFRGDRRLDAHRNTQRWCDVYEGYIRRHPDQWAWNHLRWNTKPSEVPPAFRRTAVSPREAMAFREEP